MKNGQLPFSFLRCTEITAFNILFVFLLFIYLYILKFILLFSVTICSFNYIVSFYYENYLKYLAYYYYLAYFPPFLWPYSASFSSLLLFHYIYIMLLWLCEHSQHSYIMYCAHFLPLCKFYWVTDFPPISLVFFVPVTSSYPEFWQNYNSFQYDKADNIKQECVCVFWLETLLRES